MKRDLDASLRDPGFTPSARDAPPLFERLGGDDDMARLAERALLRLGPALPALALSELGRAKGASDGGKRFARVVRLLGRIEGASDEVFAALEAAASAPEARVRRAAANALGKIARPSPALSIAFEREADASAKNAMAIALAKIGGEGASRALADEAAPERARVLASRHAARAAEARVLVDASPRAPTKIVLRCRAGLEPIVVEQAAFLGARVVTDDFGVRVEGALRGPLSSVFRARAMLDFAFPLAPTRLDADDADTLARAIAGALAGREARALFDAFIEGPVRYRVAWAGGGKRRAVVFDVAAKARAADPRLVNDPKSSDVSVFVRARRGELRIEIAPRVDDPRFAYRRGDVPAASHPTIAAALVHVAGPRADDVVWDPFVGSGLELCERHIAGRYASLLGSDRDAGALAVARENLEAAGARSYRLAPGDALHFEPPLSPTLILTNPPLGRRIERTPALKGVLTRFVARAARLLAPRGRFVWISPFPAATRDAALSSGLTLDRSFEIDLGGFAGLVQSFRKR